MRIQAFAFAALAATLLNASLARAVVDGDALPKLAIKGYQGAGGGELNNASLPGKITLINFWATWCAACKVELVEMEDQLKPLLGESDFQVAFVSLDKEPEKAAAWFLGNLKDPDTFLKRLYLDSKFETADELKVDSFPMTLIIGRDGKVARVQRGFKEGEKSTEELVRFAGKLLHNNTH
jgi:thiol-disulfide isomerase/thioredoxin